MEFGRYNFTLFVGGSSIHTGSDCLDDTNFFPNLKKYGNFIVSSSRK